MENALTQSKILICDDSLANVLIVVELLKNQGFCNVQQTTSGAKAIELMRQSTFDLLLLDIEMPEMDGLEVYARLKSEKIVDEFFPVIILTGHTDSSTKIKALNLGVADFISKPLDQIEVQLRVKNTLKLYSAYRATQNQAKYLEQEVARRTEELSYAKSLFLTRLAQVGELKDQDTGYHVIRVGKYAGVLAELYGLPSSLCNMIVTAAPLHDLGKVAIKDRILLKRDKLDDIEWVDMKTHAEVGARLLYDEDSPLAQMASSIAGTHHENWDGSGYPKGLRGESIPIEGRITALADVFDALTTKRPYKEAWPIDKALAEIHSLSGTKFDPELVKLFNDNLPQFIAIMNELAD